MSDLDDAYAKIDEWLQPLADDGAPCGPDLEYDNEFLELTQAAAGKPESQFGPAEPPDWRHAVEVAESLFERSRDLRVAMQWMRGMLHLQGYGAIVAGLKLLNGMLAVHWEYIHPLPDPDDQDPYGRVNALTLLREPSGLLGDLRDSHLVQDRAIGLLLVRDAEVALGLAAAAPDRNEMGKAQVSQIIEAAVEKDPALQARCLEAVTQLRALMSQLSEKLGNDAPDLRPLYAIVNGVAGLLPTEATPSDEREQGEASDGDGSGAGGAKVRQGLSGSVTTREEAMRAIDLVCEFLERTEPTNPAPLFLRRGRQLIGHNFLQLLKALAPNALSNVAEMVGVDPDEVESPGGS